MLNNRPEGCINSINELLELPIGVKLYKVSRKFCREVGNPQVFEGIIGAERSSNNKNYRYYYYEFTHSDGFKSKTSLMDANVIHNNYNDWYLFSKIEDARKYLGLCPHCGK